MHIMGDIFKLRFISTIVGLQYTIRPVGFDLFDRLTIEMGAHKMIHCDYTPQFSS